VALLDEKEVVHGLEGLGEAPQADEVGGAPGKTKQKAQRQGTYMEFMWSIMAAW
jgi:hypothetical protein